MSEVTYLRHMYANNKKLSRSNKKLAKTFLSLKDKEELCDFAKKQNIKVNCDSSIFDIQEEIAKELIERFFADIYNKLE